MNNKKAKERWERIQNNKKKCCLNCSQLSKHSSGNFICYFLKSPNDAPNGGCFISPIYVKQTHGICYDEYNGKNIR